MLGVSSNGVVILQIAILSREMMINQWNWGYPLLDKTTYNEGRIGGKTIAGRLILECVLPNSLDFRGLL